MSVRQLSIFAAEIIFVLAAPLSAAEPPLSELQKLHTREAEGYRIYRDEAHREALELTTKPVFHWTNLVGEHTQFGHLYVWTHAGRPEVIGTIFSTRAQDPTQRMLVHEFHTLSTRKLYPVTPRGSLFQWAPQKGITLTPCEGAPPVAKSAAQRTSQLRALARSFAGENRTKEGQTWELRLLPAPLLLYEPKSDEVLQGALFAMVSSAGTDPEVLLLIEARHPPEDTKSWSWQFAALRFSDKDLKIERDGNLVWSSREDPARAAEINADYTLISTRDGTYACYRSRFVPELADGSE